MNKKCHFISLLHSRHISMWQLNSTSHIREKQVIYISICLTDTLAKTSHQREKNDTLSLILSKICHTLLQFSHIAYIWTKQDYDRPAFGTNALKNIEILKWTIWFSSSISSKTILGLHSYIPILNKSKKPKIISAYETAFLSGILSNNFFAGSRSLQFANLAPIHPFHQLHYSHPSLSC